MRFGKLVGTVAFMVLACVAGLLFITPVQASSGEATASHTTRDVRLYSSDCPDEGPRGDRFAPYAKQCGSGSASSAQPSNQNPQFEEGRTATRWVRENTPPGVAIGAPLTATDHDDVDLTYSIQQWRDAAHFAVDSSTGQLKSKGPLDHESYARYELRVAVSDDGGGRDTIDVIITVTGVPEPPIVTGETAVKYPENQSGTVAVYFARDPEGAGVTWGLSGEDSGTFSIDGGELRFSAPPDHESPGDADRDNVYEIIVEASDRALTGSLAVEVSVTDILDPPQARAPSPTSAIETYVENDTGVVGRYPVIAGVGKGIVWSLAGEDAELFSIEDGALSFRTPPDYESPVDEDGDNEYLVSIEASDLVGSASFDVLITVIDMDEAPILAGNSVVIYGQEGTGSIATYTGNDPEEADLTWSLSGKDADAFSIEGGVLSFATSAHHEQPLESGSDNVYAVTILVSDGTHDATLEVDVTVTDVQEIPIVPVPPLASRGDPPASQRASGPLYGTRIPPRASVAKTHQATPVSEEHTPSLPQLEPTRAPSAAPILPVVREVVEKTPLWALILMFIGLATSILGVGILISPRWTDPLGLKALAKLQTRGASNFLTPGADRTHGAMRTRDVTVDGKR